MLLVAFVLAMFATLLTKDSRLDVSRDDRLGTLALELIGAPAASRELTESLLLAEDPSGLGTAASLLLSSDTELTSGELMLTMPIDIAGVSPVFLSPSPICSPPGGQVEEPGAAGLEDSTRIGSWCRSEPCSSALLSVLAQVTLASLLLATLQTELLLPLRLQEPVTPPATVQVEEEWGGALSGQLFFTKLLQEGGVPATVDETGLDDAADSGS